MIHGREREAEATVCAIEKTVEHLEACPPSPNQFTRIQTRTHTPLSEIWDTVAHKHRRRSILALVLMSSQAFFYNAIFFTYALVLIEFYGVPEQSVGLYLFPFAIGNFLGPLTIGRLFDSIGRKPMITATYFASGALLLISGWFFREGLLTARTQALCWTVIFFIASAAASSAYLTVSEIFPLEIRGMAIAVFYACGTLVGGVAAPAFFGYLIQTKSRSNLFYGYLLGASLMIVAAAVEWLIGVKAERQSLESVTTPLSAR
jgi:MFS family permease